MSPSATAPSAATCERAAAREHALAAGRRTQTERKQIKAELKQLTATAPSEDRWYEIVESQALAKVLVLELLQWLPRLGQGRDGALIVAHRMLHDAGCAPSRELGQLTLRQASALVEGLQHWQAYR